VTQASDQFRARLMAADEHRGTSGVDGGPPRLSSNLLLSWSLHWWQDDTRRRLFAVEIKTRPET
jgi:hypothetical protein